jgi:hypothetical protein
MTTIHVLEKKSLHTTVQNYRQIAIIISVRCESRTAGGEHGSSAAARVRGRAEISEEPLFADQISERHRHFDKRSAAMSEERHQ